MTTTSGSAPSMRRTASLPLAASSTTSKPSSVSIDASIWRTWSVSSTTITRMARPIGREATRRPSDGAGHSVARESLGPARDQREGDDPDHGADADGNRERHQQQPRRLTDGEEDQGQDHGAPQLVGLLGATGARRHAYHHPETEGGDRGGDPEDHDHPE